MNFIKYSLLLITASLVLYSCQKEDKDIFGKSSADRVAEQLEEIEAVLSAAENGWVMDYYAESEEAKMGGFQLLCAFNNGNVTMAGAYSMSGYITMGEVHTSLYTIADIQGPTLSFSTYNPVIHTFSQVTSSLNPDGYAGDFEFVVSELSDEKIVMRGLKENLKIVMRPLETDVDWNEYCNEVKAMTEALADYRRFTVCKSNTPIGMTTMVASSNELSNTEEVDLEVTKYTISNKGINLYSDITVAGNVVSTLTWDAANEQFVSDTDTSVTAYPTSLNFENYTGTYAVTATNLFEDVTVTISAIEGSDSQLQVSEGLFGFPFVIDVTGNVLNIKGQLLDVESETGYYVRLGVYTSTSLIITTSTGYSYTQPYEGSWYKGQAEAPVLQFYSTSTTFLIITTYSMGVRAVVYNSDSTSASNIVDYYTPIYTDLTFTKI